MKLAELRENLSYYKQSFESAWPFKHLVIDNFLQSDLIEQVLTDFPSPIEMNVHGSDSKKLVGWQTNPCSPNYTPKPSIDELFRYLKSNELRSIFQNIAGLSSPLFSDPDYYGSGLLLAPRGGKTKVHADRTFSTNQNFFPRLILLIYFNKDWHADYGGSLQLWDRKISRCATIAPAFNRCVIFELTSTSYHSIEDVSCPEDVYRRALNYNYHSDHPSPYSYIHDTMFFARPDERFDYWKNCTMTNFPKGLISTAISRSTFTRRIRSNLRLLFNANTINGVPKLSSHQDSARWSKFNAD